MLLFISWNAYGITILIGLVVFYGYVLRQNRVLLRQLFSRVFFAFFRATRAIVVADQQKGAAANSTTATPPADSKGDGNTPAN